MSGIYVALGVALAAVTATTSVWDALADRAPMPGEAVGPLVSTAGHGRAMIHADGLTPGSKRSGSFTLANEGGARELSVRTVVRESAGPRGGRLSEELLVEIRDAAGAEAGRLIWAGRLTHGAVVARLRFPAHSRRTLRMTVRLPRDARDEVQGAATAFELVWRG